MKIDRELLRWFRQHGRRELPWQQQKTPYRVWVSEIMLQQTQVTTVIPYFTRFMARFPTLEALAAAEEDEVLHYWAGLGYYSRARHLLRTAKKIQFDFQGQFPDQLAALQALPGIGRSTAGAILAIAFQRRATILDGNVKRVLSRLFAIKTWPGEKNTLDQLWTLAETLTPKTNVADYTQAMMDLGATICVRGQPLCEKCPLIQKCVAHQLGFEKTLPKARPKKILPIRDVTFLVFRFEKNVLLEKRPTQGVWGGLWSLPEWSGKIDRRVLKKFCYEKFRLKVQQIEPQTIFRHTFTHFHLNILPVLIDCQNQHQELGQCWYNLYASEKLGLPAPVKKIIERYVCDAID